MRTKTALFFVVPFFLLLCFARLTSEYTFKSQKAIFSEPISSPIFLQAISGPLPGLSADWKVLDVFGIYQEISRHNKIEYAPLMAQNLENASMLDPMFYDVYRLAGSLLVYDVKLPENGVALLDKGSRVLVNDWELAFFGGYIAHAQLGDDKKAFELMSRVIDRPKAPMLAIQLAARFLSNSSTKEDAIFFLQGLLRSVPERYRAGIREKIESMRKEAEEIK